AGAPIWIVSAAREAPQQAVLLIVLVRAPGALAKRKFFAGLFHLYALGLMPERFRIVGTSHAELSDDEFRALARTAIEGSDRSSPERDHMDLFAKRLSHARVTDGLPVIVAAVAEAKQEAGAERLLHYLS